VVSISNIRLIVMESRLQLLQMSLITNLTVKYHQGIINPQAYPFVFNHSKITFASLS
jgi:hypothetical protein